MKCPLISSDGFCDVYDGGVPSACNPGSNVCRTAIRAYYRGKGDAAYKRLKEMSDQIFAEAEYMLHHANSLGEEYMLDRADALGERYMLDRAAAIEELAIRQQAAKDEDNK